MQKPLRLNFEQLYFLKLWSADALNLDCFKILLFGKQEMLF